MNYFELFNLPVTLKVDKSQLAKKYFELQKQFHPDFFTQASEDEQADALEKSSILNTALKTLKNEDETLKYILLQKNCLQEDEKYQLPPTFLMDVMELNEDLNKETTQKIEAFESTLYVEVKDIVENYNNETVTPVQLASLKEYYYKKKYLPQDLVVAVAGNIKHKRVVAMVEEALSRDNFLEVKGDPQIRPNTPVKTKPMQSVGLLTRKTEQAHMFYGMEGVARSDERRFAMGVLASALGGGMSSRLFQEIREKRGLAYSVYAYAQQFAGSGQIGFYAGCNPTKAIEVVEIIREVLADVAENGMSHEEIERAKGAVRGSLVLSQEDSASRMSRIGKNEIVYGQVMGFDDILKAIARVNPSDVREIASEYLTKSPTLALVGPFKNEAKFEKVLRS